MNVHVSKMIGMLVRVTKSPRVHRGLTGKPCETSTTSFLRRRMVAATVAHLEFGLFGLPGMMNANIKGSGRCQNTNAKRARPERGSGSRRRSAAVDAAPNHIWNVQYPRALVVGPRPRPSDSVQAIFLNSPPAVEPAVIRRTHGFSAFVGAANPVGTGRVDPTDPAPARRACRLIGPGLTSLDIERKTAVALSTKCHLCASRRAASQARAFPSD